MTGHSRRRVLAFGGAAVAAGLVGPPAAGASGVEARIAAFTAGAVIDGDGVALTIAPFVENGVSVPVRVDAPGAASVLLLAPANPDPQAAIFTFGPRSGSQSVETRIRLAESQRVRAIARFPDGRCAETATSVEVAVGGCPS